jgi:hypothetical protein
MSREETTVAGTLGPDGTLILDEKPNLPPGRVTVVLLQEAEAAPPKDDPFWQRMQAMWDAQRASGHVPRSVAEIEAQQRQTRDGWAERQEDIERLQEEGRSARQSEAFPPSGWPISIPTASSTPWRGILPGCPR